MTSFPTFSNPRSSDSALRPASRLTPIGKSNRNTTDENISSLASLWAKKYVASIASKEEVTALRESEDLPETTSREGRSDTAQKLLKNLSFASARAWSMTEGLLSKEIQRHRIDSALINPWQIAADTHQLYETALKAYAERVTPRRLSVIVSGAFGKIRHKYTETDPRVLGFVSMQFHNTGKALLEDLSLAEQLLVNPYLKVMDDHMYMPLRNTYAAAAKHDLTSPALLAVQQLMPISTRIAYTVCDQVSRQHPGYQSYSGNLHSTVVRTSSIRDVEMFQVYLCLCVLESSIQSVQRELFPLCVMLYPRLNVRWQLVRSMLQILGWEMHDRLSAEHLAVFMPYLQVFSEMFSAEVFQD